MHPPDPLLAAVSGTFRYRPPVAVATTIFSDAAVAASANVIWWDTAVIERGSQSAGARIGFGRLLQFRGDNVLGNDPDSLIPATVFADGVACYIKEWATANVASNAELLIHFETAAERAANSNGQNNLTDNMELNGAMLMQRTDTGAHTGIKFSYDLDSAEPYNLTTAEIASMEAADDGVFDMYTKFTAWVQIGFSDVTIRMALVDLSDGHGIDLSAFTIQV